MRLPARLSARLPWLALLALLALVVRVYWPGLSGPFLLDDWGTLPKLGAWGPVDNFVTFVSYATSGISGPSGRPLSLISFLINAHNWPAPPWSFKFTNLLLHLLNGVLLVLLIRQLSAAAGLDRRRALWVGILGAGLWLAHPLLVSTTLYVVQRMAMLAALFVFAGLNCHVWGRARLAAGRLRSGYALMIAGIVGGTLLGFFCKENAALLPLLALVLEFTVLRRVGAGHARDAAWDRNDAGRAHGALLQQYVDDKPLSRASSLPPVDSPSPRPSPIKGEGENVRVGAGHARDAAWDRNDAGRAHGALLHKRCKGQRNLQPALWFRAVFLWLPSLAIAAYLLWQCRHLTAMLPNRGFSILERLLTEARILVDYLYLLVIPHGATSGLYTHVTVSQGLLDPWTTLPALVIIAALLAFAFALRRRLPVLAAAILFYFAGQLIESTTIPLELYYEHRNYLPAALLLWPLAWWIVRGPGARMLRAGIAGGALALLLALTAYRADLWGNTQALATRWISMNSDSARAVVWGAEELVAAGHPGLALAKLRQAAANQPADISIALSTLIMACSLHVARRSDLAIAVYAAGHSRAGSTLIYKNVPRLARKVEQAPCPPLNNAALLLIPKAALSNPNFAPFPALKQEFLVLRGRLLLRAGHEQAAYKAFSKALPLEVKADTALFVAAWMYAADAPRLGLKLLDEYRALPKPEHHGWSMKRLHRWWLERTGWYSESLQRVRAALQKKLHAKLKKKSA